MITKMFEQNEHKYSYIIVRNDLTNPQKAVQGTHAAIEKKYKEHPSLIFIIVKNENKLKKTMKEILEMGVNFSIFREPDANNEITAVATEPISGEKRYFFKKYQLMK